MKCEHDVFLGLGSNLGQRLNHLRAATEKICELPATKVVNFSSVYESAPIGYSQQPDFLNMVVQITTQLSPTHLLNKLKGIEKKLGRVKSFRWGPRVIDIDILFWGKMELKTDSLSIPHPEASKRKFVLVPLDEIVPEFITPPNNCTASELLDKLPDDNRIEVYLSREQYTNALRVRS